MTTALIADDEPLLRERLAAQLQRLWPELQVVAQARNGREAIELFDEHAPDIVFLDIHMPGLSGVEVARSIGARSRIVFVTAHEQYAVQAFEQGAVDYLVKPFDGPRLERTLARLRQQPGPPPEPSDRLEPLLQALAAQLRQTTPARQHLQWIKASVGSSVRLIPVDEVVYLRSDEKYTLVVWQGGEALIRKTIRELAEELDPARFVQIHRSVIVALPQVAQITRGANETADVHLHGRPEVLPVSRSYVHQFRQM
jgi:DNA-binding LytR/AlgR family response regulator